MPKNVNGVSENNLVHAYIYGFTDKTIQNGRACAHFILLNGIIINHTLDTGFVTFNFTSEFRAINYALQKYHSLNNITVLPSSAALKLPKGQ